MDKILATVPLELNPISPGEEDCAQKEPEGGLSREERLLTKIQDRKIALVT